MSPTERLAVLTAAIAAVLGVPLRAAAQDSIQPGYWETVDRVLSPIVTTKTQRRCITPADVDKFMQGPHNHIYACTYPRQVVGQGRIELAGSCVDKKGHKVSLSGNGAFTATSLHMTAEVGFKLLGVPMTATASTDARRLGDVCPPGSPGSPGAKP
jgi:hypothetical protein